MAVVSNARCPRELITLLFCVHVRRCAMSEHVPRVCKRYATDLKDTVQTRVPSDATFRSSERKRISNVLAIMFFFFFILSYYYYYYCYNNNFEKKNTP
jgi:hypothetical protein